MSFRIGAPRAIARLAASSLVSSSLASRRGLSVVVHGVDAHTASSAPLQGYAVVRGHVVVVTAASFPELRESLLAMAGAEREAAQRQAANNNWPPYWATALGSFCLMSLLMRAHAGR
jgi:hypothetical protein